MTMTHNDNDDDNQPAWSFDSTFKTHQVQQGLTDSSFLMFRWWCMAVCSDSEVICLVTPINDRDLSLVDHVKYDSYLITY